MVDLLVKLPEKQPALRVIYMPHPGRQQALAAVIQRQVAPGVGYLRAGVLQQLRGRGCAPLAG